MDYAYNSRCKDNNVPILNKLVTLRSKTASLLGYPTWAAYQQEVMMAKDPKTVALFLSGLAAKLKPVSEEPVFVCKFIGSLKAPLSLPYLYT